MKVRDLTAELAKCHPDADISLTLAEVFVFPETALADGDAGGVAYDFPFTLCAGYSTQTASPDDLADRVHIQVEDEATEKHFQFIKGLAESNPEDEDADLATSIALNAGAREGDVAVALLLRPAVAQHLRDLVRQCNRSHAASEGANTHGDLTVQSLLELLAEDAAMVVSRPGSWEGSNMAQVLSSHGYQ